MTHTPLPEAGAAYFLYHSIGMYPGKGPAMAAAFAEFAEGRAADDDAQWMRALTLRQGFIDHWQALIGAEPGTLTTAENVTVALYSLLGGLPPGVLSGRRVLFH